jgi:hypothetical protein
LHKGLTVTADDLVSILPFLFVKARVERLLAHYKFVCAFHISDEDGGQLEVYFTNFKIIVERITTFKLPLDDLYQSERTFTEVEQLYINPCHGVIHDSRDSLYSEEESK